MVWPNGFSTSWESSICEIKLHYPGNRTQDLYFPGDIASIIVSVGLNLLFNNIWISCRAKICKMTLLMRTFVRFNVLSKWPYISNMVIHSIWMFSHWSEILYKVSHKKTFNMQHFHIKGVGALKNV